MYSINTVIKLNTIAHQSADIIDRTIHQVLSQRPYRNTGASLSEVHVEVVDGDHNKAPQIKITVPDSLIILDKRRVQWTKLPIIQEMMKWAATKKTSEKEVKKLAWAVAWDKKKHDTWHAKPWRKKTLSAVLKDMNRQVLASFDEAIGEDIEASAKEGAAAAV